MLDPISSFYMSQNLYALYEYNEENGSVHANRVMGENPLLLDHKPNTNGYKPVCWLDRELNSDADFLEFRNSFCHKDISFANFSFVIQTWLKDHYPEKASVYLRGYPSSSLRERRHRAFLSCLVA